MIYFHSKLVVEKDSASAVHCLPPQFLLGVFSFILMKLDCCLLIIKFKWNLKCGSVVFNEISGSQLYLKINAPVFSFS